MKTSLLLTFVFPSEETMGRGKGLCQSPAFRPCLCSAPGSPFLSGILCPCLEMDLVISVFQSSADDAPIEETGLGLERECVDEALALL